KAMRDSESTYLELLKTVSPQAARTILPNSCKTEIVVYATLMEWGHIFAQRTSPAAEPSMRELMIPLLAECKKLFPAVFAEFS
ncbi:MAG: FAD-dependent thymidylate synthase, partial [Deltaproteobacteria bacterium]|nr:FAD-dependent thymidylate synthase [Deltaproteobacteria bacterium]